MFQIDEDFLDFSADTPRPTSGSPKPTSTRNGPVTTACTSSAENESNFRGSCDARTSVPSALCRGRGVLSNQSLDKLKSFHFVRRVDPARQRWPPGSQPTNSSGSNSLDRASVVSPHMGQEPWTAKEHDAHLTPSSSGGGRSEHAGGSHFGRPRQLLSERHSGTCNFSPTSLSDVSPQASSYEMSSQRTLRPLDNCTPAVFVGCASARERRLVEQPVQPNAPDIMCPVSSANIGRSHKSLTSSDDNMSSPIVAATLSTLSMATPTPLSTPTCQTPAPLTTPTLQPPVALSSTDSRTLTPQSASGSRVLAPVTTPTSRRPIGKSPACLRGPHVRMVPVTFSSKRKFPGPAGILPKLVSLLRERCF